MADEYEYDDDVQEEKYCKIYDRNDFFTSVVQIALAFCCLGALWYKRLTETPMRTFWTWFMDVFKQGAGACYAHVLNMVGEVQTKLRKILSYECHFLTTSLFFDANLILDYCSGFIGEYARGYQYTKGSVRLVRNEFLD